MTEKGVQRDLRSPEEIQADIERQREELAATVDALTARFDVKARAGAKVEEARQLATDSEGRPRAGVVAAGAAVLVGVVLLAWWSRR